MKGQVLIDRIRDEMAAAKNDYVSMMGELMTAYLRIHPDTEIDGTLKPVGAFNALREAARKKQKGGCYAMPPREVFDGMLDYYKLPHADAVFVDAFFEEVFHGAAGAAGGRAGTGAGAGRRTGTGRSAAPPARTGRCLSRPVVPGR